MKQYLDILGDIYHNCHDLRMNRTGTPDVGANHPFLFMHDMSQGFPLVTTKQMGLKNIATELEFFINGITDKKWLQDRKCYIWNQWGEQNKVREKYNIELAKLNNPTDAEKKQLHDKVADAERDLGPVYGFQWRHFGGEYVWNENIIDANPRLNYNPEKPGVDQMKIVVDTLHKNPTDRRMVIDAWNRIDFDDMALPPCHYSHTLLVRNGCLSLTWVQRSCDMFLGVPYNIASYALLLLLYAKEANLKPGILSGLLIDSHIYQNHLPQVAEQLKRDPKPLPTVEIPDDKWRGIFNWKATDFVLKNYVHHEKLKGDVAR